MRGRKDSQTQFFYSIDVESRIGQDHPLRVLKRRIDSILLGMDALFSQAYKHGRGPKTVGADAGFDSGEFLLALEDRRIEPHIAMTSKQPADLATAREDRKEKIAARQRMRERQQSVGDTISQRVRKRIEECFGWLESIAGLGRSRWSGRWKLRQYFELTAAAYNLVRMIKLQPT